MSTYKVKVNGVSYDVEVELAGGAPVAQAPAPAQTQEAAPAPSASQGAGSVRVEAEVAGKIFKITTTPGQAVNAGDAIVILEAMKMEIPVVAPVDGTVASIEVKEGDAVEVGYLIATMN